MIMLDETTNVGDEKEFQLLIRFWSNESNQTTIRHLKTFFSKWNRKGYVEIFSGSDR